MVRGSVPGKTQDTGSHILTVFKNRVHLLKASFQDLRPNLTMSSNFETEVLYLSKLKKKKKPLYFVEVVEENALYIPFLPNL
jgi:hypothetical protein